MLFNSHACYVHVLIFQGRAFPRHLFPPSFVSETPRGLPVSDFVWNMSSGNLKRSTYKGLRAIYSKVCATKNMAVFMWWVYTALMNCNRKTVASVFSDSSQHSQRDTEGAKEGSRHKDKMQTNWKIYQSVICRICGGCGVCAYKKDSSLSALQTAGSGYADWISIITPIFFSTCFVQVPENRHSLS